MGMILGKKYFDLNLYFWTYLGTMLDRPHIALIQF